MTASAGAGPDDDASGLFGMFSRLVGRLDRLSDAFSRSAGRATSGSSSSGPSGGDHSSFRDALRDAQIRMMKEMAEMPPEIRRNVKFNTFKFRFRDPKSVDENGNADVTEVWSHINNPYRRMGPKTNFGNLMSGFIGQGNLNQAAAATSAVSSFAPAPVAQGFTNALMKTRGWMELDDYLQKMARRIKDEGGSFMLQAGVGLARGATGMAMTATFAGTALVGTIQALADTIKRSYSYQAQALAPYNAQVMSANASLVLGDISRANRLGSMVSGTFSNLTADIGVFRERMLPIQGMMLNLSNAAGSVGLGTAGQVMKMFGEIALPAAAGAFNMVRGGGIQAILKNQILGPLDNVIKNNNGLNALGLNVAREALSKLIDNAAGNMAPIDVEAMMKLFADKRDDLPPGAFAAGLTAAGFGVLGIGSGGKMGLEGAEAAFDKAVADWRRDQQRERERFGNLWDGVVNMAFRGNAARGPLNPSRRRPRLGGIEDLERLGFDNRRPGRWMQPAGPPVRRRVVGPDGGIVNQLDFPRPFFAH